MGVNFLADAFDRSGEGCEEHSIVPLPQGAPGDEGVCPS